MVGLHQRHIKILQVADRIIIVAPHVRRHRCCLSALLDPVSHRIRCIVRNVKGLRPHIPDGKGRVRRDDPEKRRVDFPNRHIPHDLPDGCRRRIDWNLHLPRKNAQSADMVRMLVRDQNTCQIGQASADPGKSLRDPLAADARINQNRCFIRPGKDAVPAASTCNTTEIHGFPVSFLLLTKTAPENGSAALLPAA